MNWFSQLFNRKPAVAIGTGVVLSAATLREQLGGAAVLGDATYAEVNSAWLAVFADIYASALFNLDVTKWDVRFDCNHFATFYSALAQIKFYAANFQSSTLAQSLAVGELWYTPSWAPRGAMHAINVACTDKGILYVEPQTRQIVKLTDAEWASRSLVKF